MSGTVIWNGYETSLDTVALYIEIKVEYREAPFPETLKDWGYGPEFVEADEHMDTVLTIGGRRPKLIEDSTGIKIDVQQYGVIFDAYESWDWDNGDPSGQGDWRGEDYFKNSVGVISTVPTDGYQDWITDGKLTPNSYNGRPETFYVVEMVSSSELQTVLNRAANVTETGNTPDQNFIDISNFLATQGADPDKFDLPYRPNKLGEWTFENLYDDYVSDLTGIDVKNFETSYNASDLSTPLTQAAVTYLEAVLAEKGQPHMAEQFSTVGEAQLFVDSLQDVYVDRGLDLIEQTRGGTSFTKWVEANEGHIADMAEALIDNSDLGQIFRDLALVVRDRTYGTTASVYRTADSWGFDAAHMSQLSDVEVARYIGSQTSDTVYAYESALYAFTGQGSDNLYGGAQADWLAAGRGRDMIWAEAGNDKVHGGGGVDDISGGAGKDRIWGGSGDDWIYGGDQRDRLLGGNGDDYLLGGDGNDRLNGGAGDDQIEGEKGSDTLTGGAGSDAFVFTNFRGPYYTPSGRDTVTDFDADEGDSLVLFLKGFSSVADIEAVARQDGDDLVIEFGRRDVLTLNDTTWKDVKKSIDIIDIVDTYDII